jgi:hypothetical protein
MGDDAWDSFNLIFYFFLKILSTQMSWENLRGKTIKGKGVEERDRQ